MRPRQPIPLPLQQLGELQAEVVTRRQALESGLGRHAVERLLTNGDWQRLACGLYYCGTRAAPWEALAWGGVLLGGESARLGGQAAGYLHSLLESAPARIEVLVPYGGGTPRVDGPWAFRRERSGVRSARSVGSPARLNIEDTVLDLAAAASDPRRVVELVTVAAQSRRTTAEHLMAALERRRMQPNRALLLKLLRDVHAGVRSPLEFDYLNLVERPHGLPVGERQRPRTKSEVDVWYELYRLLVELDGREGHLGLGRFRDMRRDNRATTDGLATLRYGAYDVFGCPCAVARQVWENLTLRGYDRPFRCCARCRSAA